MLYLNDGLADFTGGETTFYSTERGAAPWPGPLAARGVTPRVGAVLLFPHGETPHPDEGVAGGFLVHEGSVVRSGVKVILRTDVLYEVAST